MRNVPDEVERLERLAAQYGASVSAVAVRELADAPRRADNRLLLDALPDLDISSADIAAAVTAEHIAS